MMKQQQLSGRRKAIFAVVVALVLLLGLEFGFRGVISLSSARLVEMIDTHRERYYGRADQELSYRPHPYFGYTRRDKGEGDGINRLGFWGPELALEKPPGTLRVVALGGSTTAGPSAWPYQLQGEIKRRLSGMDVQVQNLGIGGWTSAEALAAFSMVGLSYSPDVVVVHCVNNDLEPMRARELAVDYSHYRRAMNVDQTDTGTATFKVNLLDAIDAYLARRLDLYVYAKLFRAEAVPLRASLHGLTTWTQATRAEPSEAGIAIFERNLRSIAALAAANGAAMVLTTMPVAPAASPSVGGIPDGHRRSLALQNSRLRALAEREGWVLADLALLADALTSHFEDAIHVSVAGERLKAEAIADAVEAAGLLNPKAQIESD